MAPEVIDNSKYDTKSNIYSLYVLIIMQELFCVDENTFVIFDSDSELLTQFYFPLREYEDNENDGKFLWKSIKMQMNYTIECLKENFINYRIVKK